MMNAKSKKRLFVLLMALLLIVLSWWGVAAAQTGLVVRSLEQDNIPMLYVAPGQREKMPSVLIAHGFAGSKQLMLGYAYVLAHSGYAVMLWDFGGHGANTKPLEGFSLQHDLNVAYNVLLEQPGVDPTRLALLGHSMGSGAVMSAAISNSDRFAATVAISPTYAAVTPQVPHNLQLQAGSWEGSFIANAEKILQQAGGENQNLAQGKGRSLVIVPNAEHITILLRNASHMAARKWLDATFNIQTTSNYVDLRMAWYGLHLLGWLLMLGAVAPILTLPTHLERSRWLQVRSWGGLLLAPVVASGVLTWVSGKGEIQNFGGVQVGGAVGIWFFVAGITWLLAIFRLPLPKLRSLGLGIALFILLWIAFGAMAQVVWLQWWLIPVRLQLWLILSLLCFPWFLASGIAQQKVGINCRFIWWLGQSIALVGGFFLTLQFVPQLSFIFLLLPLFPLFTAMFSYVAAMLNEVWIYTLGCALFFGWVIAAAFPLSS